MEQMKADILNNLENPENLEYLYQNNTALFKRAFLLLYPDIHQNTIANIWNVRLNFRHSTNPTENRFDYTFLIFSILIAGFLAKIPDFFALDHDHFFTRNIGFIVFPFLVGFFSWKQNLPMKQIALIGFAFLFSLIYINILPDMAHSDTLMLACLHLLFFLWAILGYSFLGNNRSDIIKRLDFLKFNGDLVIMGTIMVISGAILTAVTFALFSLIEINIESFFNSYVVFWLIPSAPIIGTYLVYKNPNLVNKISPVIAKLFTPLVFVVLIIYLAAIIYTGKDPYGDREFLLIFNILLVGIMAIILFSTSEYSKDENFGIGKFILFGLSVLTIIVNGIALSAILFRISEWGITPNRLAVLGGNVLILINLMLVVYRLFGVLTNKNKMEDVEFSIASYLPVYILWTIIVTFLFPVLFSFR